MNYHKITQAILALSLVVTQQALAADEPDAQQRLKEDFLDAVFAKQGIKAIAEIIKKGADVNATYGVQGKTALYFAVENDDKKLAELLLQHGAEVDAKYKGKMPLYLAAEKGDLEIVALLLKSGANANATSVVGGYPGTPLLAAIKNNHPKIVELLLKHEADPNKLTPIMLAYDQGNNDIVNILLQHGAKPGWDLFNKASAKKDKASIILFLKYYKTNITMPLPTDAIKGGDIEIVKLLLKHGFDINKADVKKGGRGYFVDPALHTAVKAGQYSMTQFLLTHGANPYVRPYWAGRRYQTPFEIAIRKNDKKMVALLLKYGADPKKNVVRTGSRHHPYKTPIELAKELGNREILKLLQQGKREQRREQRKEKWQKIMKKK